VSRIVYGDRSVDGTAFSGGGAASSDDPIYIYALAVLSLVLLAAAAARRRVTAAAVVGVGGLLFTVIWCVAIWNGSAQELPRLNVLPGTLCHLSLLLVIAGSLDGLLRRTTGNDHGISDRNAERVGQQPHDQSVDSGSGVHNPAGNADG
jgi:hypothetical protein